MSDPVDASNAIVSAVNFYAKALAEERAARQQAEAAFRAALAQREDKELQALVRAAIEWNHGGTRACDDVELRAALAEAVNEYERSRNAVGGVESHRAHSRAVRAAPAPSDADLPRTDG